MLIGRASVCLAAIRDASAGAAHRADPSCRCMDGEVQPLMMVSTIARELRGLPAVESETATLPGLEPWCAAGTRTSARNVLTIDLEDWPVAVLGPDHDITPRVVENTKRCLQILAWHGVRATFFVLTRIAETYPDLVREVHAAGHEIASHGHRHEVLPTISPSRFERDLQQSMEILTDLIGERPIGYRAPAFSIVETTRWAGPILVKSGFKYSSSVFPIRHRRYGIAQAPRRIHRWSNCPLIECPPATVSLSGLKLPVAGGGYFRLLPGPVARAAIRRINREHMPGILYFHPYELDVHGIRAHRRSGAKVGYVRHLTQAAFRNRMERRLHRLLEQFRFTTLRELLRHAL